MWPKSLNERRELAVALYVRNDKSSRAFRDRRVLYNQYQQIDPFEKVKKKLHDYKLVLFSNHIVGLGLRTQLNQSHA